MKKITLIAAFLITVSVGSKLQAQPNPGPGNQGSGTGPTTDGPTVPFDNRMNLIFISTVIGAIYMANRRGVLALK